MKTTRTPQQKRSIEKRTKILEAAFILFSEKGFENTNTAEISQHAGVATGTLYSYFQDKVDIYKTVFESYLKKEVSKMLSELECEINNHTNISQFILLWKDSYLSLFGKPNRALKEINSVMSKVQSLNKFFSDFETEYVESIYKILKEKYNPEITFEKVWIAFLLIDELSKEYVSSRHKKINYNLLEKQAIVFIETLLTNDGG